MDIKFYKLEISYDGTDYFGWQEQKDQITISGTLKKSFLRTFNKNISILGASRTDAGVHASGQIAKINTDLSIDPNRLLSVWNSVLPKDILIKSIDLIDNSFNPLKNVPSILKPSVPLMALCCWYALK